MLDDPDIEHYEILRVPATADARTIKRAFRRLIQQYHPDTNKVQDDAERAISINASYEILADPQKRADYDLLRQARYTYGGGRASRKAYKERLASWRRHEAGIIQQMKEWRRQHGYAEGEQYRDDTMLVIPAVGGTPRLTLPNLIYQEQQLIAGVWVEDTEDRFTVACYLVSHDYSAVRRFVEPDGIAYALATSLQEIRVISQV